MNWNAIGAIAELVGAIGVIASLVYLASQIRQNTRSIRSGSYQAVNTNLSNFALSIGLDASAADTMNRGVTDFDTLNAKERSQFSFLMLGLFRAFENIFYQHEQGMLDESVWVGWERRVIRYFWQPGVQTWWPSWRNDCHAEFRSFLEQSTPGDASPILGDLVGVGDDSAA